MSLGMAMDVGSIAKVAAWVGRRAGGTMESALNVMVPLVALVGCLLAGYLVLGRWLTSPTSWMKKVMGAFRPLQPSDQMSPGVSFDDFFDKMCEVDFNVKEVLAKSREAVSAEALDGAVGTILRRLEVLENSVQGTHDRIQNLVDVIKALQARLDEVHAGILKGQATLAQENAKSMKEAGKKENAGVLEAIQDKFDKVLKEVQLSLVETQKLTTQSTQPIKKSQESFSAALNEKVTEILKEISNVFHRVKKESGDLMAMVRWTGSKVEQVENLCAHQPERLQILRDTLLEVQTTVVRIQTEMEAAQEGGDGAHSPPQRQEWTQQPPQQAAASTPPPATSGTPHTINLDETVPVQLMRPSSSPLTSLALADGRVIYVPRQVVSSLFGAQF